jgi:hypothetical protein
MKITQVELFDGNDRIVCWLPVDSKMKLKVGMRLTLQDTFEKVWTIGEIFSTMDHYEINRKWDVGGL